MECAKDSSIASAEPSRTLQTELADKVIDAIQTEQGFPCAHRPVHEYVIGANSIAAVYEDYTHEVKKYNRLTTSQVKTLCKSTFTRRVRVRRPRLKFKKVMTDLCNRCYELDILIFSASSREDRRRLLKAKLMHLKQALHQRILMNAIIRTACKTLGLPGQSSAKLLLPETELELENDNIDDDANSLQKMIKKETIPANFEPVH